MDIFYRTPILLVLFYNINFEKIDHKNNYKKIIIDNIILTLKYIRTIIPANNFY